MTQLPTDVLGWAQLLVWSLLASVLAVLLLIMSKAAGLLEFVEQLLPALRRWLQASRFMAPDRAGEPAPNTYPPRPSKPDQVALERPVVPDASERPRP